MTKDTHAPGPWEIREIAHEATPFGPRRVYRVEIGSPIIDRASKHRYGTRRVCQITDFADFTNDTANARLIAAAPDLLAAAQKLEAAETFHANCEECEGEGAPEFCEHCFPLFDDARVMRRNAIAKAESA